MDASVVRHAAVEIGPDGTTSLRFDLERPQQGTRGEELLTPILLAGGWAKTTL
jgi:hypothetical protein